MNKEIIQKFRLIIISFFVYFALDFPIRVLNLSYFEPCFGLKSFLPITLGLLLGIYGIIGEVTSVIVSFIITKTNINYLFIELIFVILPGFTIWILWNSFTKKPGLSFKHFLSYIKFILISAISFMISTIISFYVFNYNDPIRLFLWYFILTLLIGIPTLILYRGIFCIKPIIPKKNFKGEEIIIKDDIDACLNNDSKSIADFNQIFEDFALSKNIGMKKIFEVQNLIEELYIRIIKAYDKINIKLTINYDITFSIEFSYEGEKHNPLRILKTEDNVDVMGIKLIKHRAITAAYDYLFGENFVHLVI